MRTVNNTVNFNSNYGDLSFTNGDSYKELSIIYNHHHSATQAITNLLKSSYGDYHLQPQYGADFQKYIGLSVSKELADAIKAEVESKLNEIPQVKGLNPNILYILEKNTIIFRITLSSAPHGSASKGIDFSFSKDKGVVIM